MKHAEKQYDLTQGPILNRLLLVALPIMGTSLMQMAYNLTDMFWLGRLGSDAVAASGSAGMYMWLSMGPMMIGRMGTEIGVSQCLGRKEEQEAKGYAWNSMFLSLVFGVLFGLAMVLLNRPLIGFFDIQEAHVARDAASYLRIVGLGVPLTYLSAAVAGAFNGSGNSRTPFYINSFGLVVNMILDPLFIFGLGMDIQGAAIATILAQAVVCVTSVLALLLDRGRPFVQFRLFDKPDREKIRQVFKWSIPIALESMLFCFLSMVISRFVASWGASAIAVQRVGSQIESLTWLVGGSFGTALTAFVGQNFGARKWGRIHKCFGLSLAAITCWGAAVTVFLVVLGGPLYAVFLPGEHEIIAAGVVYLRILASCQICACFEAVCAGAFRGVGRTIPPSIVSISGNTIRVGIAYVLAFHTSLGLNGLWWGIALGSVLRGIVDLIWYLAASRKMPQEDFPEPTASQV